jgi:hypothetical protein
MIKTCHGSCHCKAVTFDADIDFALGSYKCNCTICAKTRYWGINVKPESFRLISGADALTDYRYHTRRMQILFCKHCGVAPFSRGNIPELGGAVLSVSAAALDGIAPAELLSGPVTYFDGLHDDFANPPAETRHL